MCWIDSTYFVVGHLLEFGDFESFVLRSLWQATSLQNFGWTWHWRLWTWSLIGMWPQQCGRTSIFTSSWCLGGWTPGSAAPPPGTSSFRRQGFRAQPSAWSGMPGTGGTSLGKPLTIFFVFGKKIIDILFDSCKLEIQGVYFCLNCFFLIAVDSSIAMFRRLVSLCWLVRPAIDWPGPRRWWILCAWHSNGLTRRMRRQHDVGDSYKSCWRYNGWKGYGTIGLPKGATVFEFVCESATSKSWNHPS